jgi:hypothetical protein
VRHRVQKRGSRVAIESFSDLGNFVFSTETPKAKWGRGRMQAGTPISAEPPL